MNSMRVSRKYFLLISISLPYVIGAAQNTPQEQIPTPAVTAPGTVSNVLSNQSKPAQQTVAPITTTGAPSVTQLQPPAQATTDSVKKEAAAQQTPSAQPAVAPVQTSTPVVPAASSVAPAVPPVTAPAITAAVPSVTTPAVTVAPTDQTGQQVQQTTVQPAVEQPTAQMQAEAKTEASQPEVSKEKAVTGELAKKQAEQELPQAPAVAPDVKTVEEPAQPVKKQVVPAGEGIDTLEQEGGNWLLKRQALEKTIDVIEKIKDVFTKILETRVDYLVKRNKTDRSFDTFANSIGFELGDLNQLLSRLVKQLKAERVKDGDLTQEERDVLQDVENKITELKSLKTTLNEITEMDASLDEALMQLEKEITTSNSYQSRAWRNFQTIKKVLSDEKAEELYLQTESLLKNMQEILKYLNGDLLQYFNGLIETLKQDMSTTQEKIKLLAEKGINLQDEVKKIKKAEKLARKQKLQTKEDAQKKEKEKAAEPVVSPKVVKKEEGWFDYIAVMWRYPLSIVGSIWDYGMSFFVTKKPVVRPINVSKASETSKNAAQKEMIESVAKEVKSKEIVNQKEKQK